MISKICKPVMLSIIGFILVIVISACSSGISAPTTPSAVENSTQPTEVQEIEPAESPETLPPALSETSSDEILSDTSDIRVGWSSWFAGYEWVVLTKTKDTALIVTRDIIDTKEYDEPGWAITWENCTLRHWLNTDFLETFSESEKSMIIETNVVNNDNPIYGIDSGNDTVDKVFLLSLEEAQAYFDDDNSRIAVQNMTAAKLEIAAEAWGYDGALGDITRHNGLPGKWRLRTAGFKENQVVDVGGDGEISASGGSPNNVPAGVRPAMWVRIDALSSVAVSGGQEEGAVSGGQEDGYGIFEYDGPGLEMLEATVMLKNGYLLDYVVGQKGTAQTQWHIERALLTSKELSAAPHANESSYNSEGMGEIYVATISPSSFKTISADDDFAYRFMLDVSDGRQYDCIVHIDSSGSTDFSHITVFVSRDGQTIMSTKNTDSTAWVSLVDWGKKQYQVDSIDVLSSD